MSILHLLQPGEVALTKSSIALTGSSQTMVAANPLRSIVIFGSTESNSAAAVDITGGTAALDNALPLPAGTAVKITGKAAQSAMTCIGAAGQKLTVYTG